MFRHLFRTLSLVTTEQQLAEKDDQIADLKHQVELLTRAILGQKSERFATADNASVAQVGLFGTVEAELPTTVAEVPAHKRTSRKGKHPGRHEIADHLPRRTELLLPPGIDGNVLDDGSIEVSGYKVIGTEVTERIEFIPGSITVVETRRPKLVKIEGPSEETSAVMVAPLPPRLLSKCMADETLVVELIIRKFCEHMPLYRQAQAFKRDYDWVVPRSTLGNWVDRVAVALRPLHDEIRRQIFDGDYIQMDETGLLVLAPPGPNAEGSKSKQPKPKSQKLRKKLSVKESRRHQGQMWLARDPVSGLVLFEYDKARSHALPKKLLAEYKGYLQVDGWGAYRTALSKLTVVPKGEAVGQYTDAPIKLVFCLAHVRRKFFDALIAHATVAKDALVQIQQMYKVEAEAAEFTPTARLAHRQTHLKPLFEKFSEWLEGYRNKVIPKGGLSRAIKYSLNQWPLSAPILEDGRILLDNNGIENEVRGQALGRKNYLFAGSHRAAQNIAVLYSLLTSCKVNGVNPRVWLVKTIARLAVEKVEQPEKWLPNWQE